MNTSAVATTAVASPSSFRDTLGDVSDLKVDWDGAAGGDEGAMPVDAAPVPDGDQAAPQAPAAAPVAPAAETPAPQQSAQPDLAAFMRDTNQAQQLFMAQMQQQLASVIERLPQMFAQVLPKPPEAPAPDPYADLDQNDPDYHYNRLGRDNKLLRDELAEIKKWRADLERAGTQEQEQAKQAQAQAAHAAHVKGEVERSVFQLFGDAPRTPETEQLFQLACEQMDSNWRASGWQSAGAARGWQAAQKLVNMYLPLLKAQAQASTKPAADPAMGAAGKAPTLESHAQLGEDPFARMKRTRAADAAAFSAAFNQTN